MSKKVFAGTSKPVTQIEDGKYSAILNQIIMIGSHKFTSKKGKEFYSPQVIVGFELPKLTYEYDGETLTTVKSGTYFLSMNPSWNGALGLREIIDGFHGPDYTEAEAKELEEGTFDVAQYLGKSCLLTIDQVESKGKFYSTITSIEKVKGSDMLIEGKREPVLITLDDFRDIDNLNVPQWVKDKIMDSKEYQDLPKVAPLNEQFESKEEIKIEDVPF